VTTAATSPPLRLLLRPRWQGLTNAWDRADLGRKFAWGTFGAMTLMFWAGVFAVCVYFLRMLNGVELFGPLLLRKVLSMLLMSFSGLLFFSNVVTALSSYFLSDDMQLVQALPISQRRVFYFRLLDTMMGSSWMILIFGLPVLLAYGVVYEGGLLYYAVAVAGLLAYLLPPAALGIVVACVLVRGFSASRIRELMAMVSGVFIMALLLLIRALKPERLIGNPEEYETLAEFLAVVQAPDASWLPSTWLAELCMWSLGNAVSSPLLSAGLLFVAGPSLVILARWLVAPMWFDAWTNAQEAPKKAASRSTIVTTVIDGITAPLPATWRSLLRKDLRLFLREPGQWTQGLLLVGLVIIYLYSVHSLPLESLPLKQGVLTNAIAFLNVGVAGSVIAAISVRFSFTAVSQEGRAFWVLHASPIGARRYLWSKWAMAFWPALLLGEVLVLSTNAMLNVDPLYGWIAGGTIALMAAGLTGLAVGMGALYPNFKADSAARVASGPGAIFFMVAALSFVAFVVTVEAIPVGVLLAKQYQGQSADSGLIGALIGAALLVVLANTLATVVPLHRGARKLWGDLGNVGD
jgi:ABC-2 type transport system permease protein